jgi:hypothetical protein
VAGLEPAMAALFNFALAAAAISKLPVSVSASDISEMSEKVEE